MKYKTHNGNSTTLKIFEGVEYYVEATFDEQYLLWEKYHNEYEWDSEGLGTSPTIGELADHPVVVCVFFAKINGHRVAFYEAVSLVVHHGMVADWMKETLPGIEHTNVANFGHCLYYCKK